MLPFFKYNAGDHEPLQLVQRLRPGLAAGRRRGFHQTAARFGKRSLFIASMVLDRRFSPWLCLCCRRRATAAIFASEVLRQFSFGCSCPVLWAMIADVADYGEWKTGRRATGTVTSAVVFALWLGLAPRRRDRRLAFRCVRLRAQRHADRHSLTGIRLVASVYSGLAFFATAVCLLFYPITRSKNRGSPTNWPSGARGFAMPAHTRSLTESMMHFRLGCDRPAALARRHAFASQPP